MKVVMPTRLKNILTKRRLLISATIRVIGVLLVALLVAGRTNRPTQAAPRPLDVEMLIVNCSTRS